MRPGRADHTAPEESCSCGVYASDSPLAAASFITGPEQPVIGRVSLWGTVVECEHGWRAACAYPAALYVPALPEDVDPDDPWTDWPSVLARLLGPAHAEHGRWDSPPSAGGTPHAQAIARALDAYGVPIEIVVDGTLSRAAEALASD